jgi:cilia- and flagella-associated protein 52
LAISRTGRYLASGQVTYMGFTADIVIWDLENRQLLHRMALHKVGYRSKAGVQRHTDDTYNAHNP